MNTTKQLNHIVIFGASGAMGRAFTKRIRLYYPKAVITTFSREACHDATVNTHVIDYFDESQMKTAADSIQSVDLILVATGMLHSDTIQPEKSYRQIQPINMLEVYRVNTVLPMVIAKYFLPKLPKDQCGYMAILSARVGSISDNRLGGWHSYRASKAALNMLVRNLAIECRRHIIVGIHPGTVDSQLSKPYQGSTEVFTPDYAATMCLSVLNDLTLDNSGYCYAWDGAAIDP